MFNWVNKVGLCGVVCVTVACGDAGDAGDAGGAGDGENIGMATFELASVPSGVGCIRIAVVGSTVTKDFNQAAGTSTAALNMDRLPLGTVSISGSAYQTTCGTGATLYVADPAVAVLETGVLSTLALTFRKNNAVAADVNFVGNVTVLAAGGNNTALVMDGQVYTWGQYPATNVPTLVAGLSSVVDVAVSGSDGFCALKSDRTIWCWGTNSFMQAGVASGAVPTPTRLGTDTDWTSLSAGGFHFCASKGQSKTTKCWGYNAFGQLGNGTTTNTATPTTINFSGFASALSGGPSHSCMVSAIDQKMYCVGQNSWGQLGNGLTTNSTTWQITGQLGRSVSAGTSHSCAIGADTALRCWGSNNDGQLGTGNTNASLVAVGVSGGSLATVVRAGNNFSCALTGPGSVKCWGANTWGQLGLGDDVTRTSPSTVSMVGNAEMLAVGDRHACAFTETHQLYCWGYNYNGQLGDGSYVIRRSPVPVRLP